MSKTGNAMDYRRIFHNDKISFGEMQVYSLARDYIDKPDELENRWGYEDEFIKEMVCVDGAQIVELYATISETEKKTYPMVSMTDQQSHWYFLKST